MRGQVEPIGVMNWSAHLWSRGTYAYRAAGQIARYGNICAQAHGRLHFAGEHTAVLVPGLEGAMESGERAALEVLERIRAQRKSRVAQDTPSRWRAPSVRSRTTISGVCAHRHHS